MKFKRVLLCAMVAVMLFGMAGCGLLEKEYYAEKPHVQQYQPVAGSNALQAENFEGLKDAVLSFVWDMDTSGTVQLGEYIGNITEDLATLRTYIMRQDAIGAYSVEDIVFYVNRIVSHYEVTFEIQYRRTVMEMARIVSVADSDEAYGELVRAMKAHDENLVMKLSYFEGWEDGIEDYCAEIYYSDPENAFFIPVITWDVYPEVGTQRIIHINFDHFLTGESYRRYREMTMEAAGEVLDNSITTKLEGSVLRQRAALYDFYAYLYENVDFNMDAMQQPEEYDDRTTSIAGTAFGALVNKNATGEGVAMAYKLLCDQVNIECMVVRGRRDAFDHFWNIVCVDGVYYHVDATLEDGCLLSDEEMPGNYIWSRETYPACR
ncbi:MAG: hypothetical protein IJP23_04565 [Oscillospiraceae bacterium]|nr:hypothetical protein [Oscillospiraceae bacterium]